MDISLAVENTPTPRGKKKTGEVEHVIGGQYYAWKDLRDQKKSLAWYRREIKNNLSWCAHYLPDSIEKVAGGEVKVHPVALRGKLWIVPSCQWSTIQQTIFFAPRRFFQSCPTIRHRSPCPCMPADQSVSRLTGTGSKPFASMLTPSTRGTVRAYRPLGSYPENWSCFKPSASMLTNPKTNNFICLQMR
jgi:hypothetical protein